MNASVSAAPAATLTRRQVNDLAVLNIATSPSECRESTREKNLPLPSGYHLFWWLPSATSRGQQRVRMTQRPCPTGNSRRDYDASIARPGDFTSRICPDMIVTLR